MPLTVVVDDDFIIPDGIYDDIDAFREWAGSDDLPEHVRVDFFRGEVWVDMGKQQIFSHVVVKTEVARVLAGLDPESDVGMFLINGVLVTNRAAGWSGNPDGTYISNDALEAGRVKLVAGRKEGYVEIQGTPDMVLEIVSTKSVKKDTVRLRKAYHAVGIPEYWLIDARGEVPLFDILKRGPRGYVETRKVGGWLKSAAFGRSFKLTRTANRLGHPVFTLAVK